MYYLQLGNLYIYLIALAITFRCVISLFFCFNRILESFISYFLVSYATVSPLFNLYICTIYNFNLIFTKIN